MAKVEPGAGAVASRVAAVLPPPRASPPPPLHSSPRDGVALNCTSYALVWACLYALHAVCALYFVLAGLLYSALPGTQVSNMLELYQLTINPAHFTTIAGFHFTIAAVHCCLCLAPVYRRLLSFTVLQATRNHLRSSQVELTRRLSSSRVISALLVAYVKVSWPTRRVYSLLFARDGLLGIQNQHFELLFVAREVVETVLQSYQGYNMSRLLPDMRLNRFYTIILIVNCFTTPILRRLFQHRLSIQRLLVVTFDILLDFASSVGVPVVVAADYVAHYDPATTDFAPYTLWYDDRWLLTFLNEAPLVLCGNWFDLVCRVVFSLALLSAIEDVKSLIHPPAVVSQSMPPVTDVQLFHSTLTSSTSRQGSAIALALQNPVNQARISRWVYRVLALWGVCIAGAFTEAYLRDSPAFCALELRPWLVKKPACGIVMINCLKSPLSGKLAEVGAIFDSMDAGSVEHVIFRHCAHVEIPLQFTALNNLYGLKTYNSTIISWTTEAAVTTHAHPRVRFAFFVKTQFLNSELPPGLLHTDFPPTLGDIEICGSNLRVLPDSLPWPLTSTIYVEFSQLDAFPLVLSRLKPYTLSLAFNSISEFPAEAIMTPDIAKFTLRGNPVLELPGMGVDIAQLHDTGTGVNLFRLSLEYTNIATLPPWVTKQFLEQIELRAGGSPICTEILDRTDSTQRQELLKERPWLSEVDCRDPGLVPNYPIQVDEVPDEFR